ncbi:Acg family FMN-binding oxidoreductase [Streptosporangium sp. NPDC001559]|uniref:Acg family FMN-binding oxidoreductase n=1 Tax=Streptosporangium sp. NPDC001559 TaxID=3366187 RepID=UPI0036EA2364
MIGVLGNGLEVQRLVAAAGNAPSVHNTQPWRFSVEHGDLMWLCPDLERRLTAADPHGRSLHVSCGAALLNLRLALRAAGYDPVSWLLPPGERPPPLAVVRPVPSVPPSPEERRLYDAITVRHTNRLPFSGCLIPYPIMNELVRAARCEGANLIVLNAVEDDPLLRWVGAAERRLYADADYRAELTRWTTSTGGSRLDGIPATALGPSGGKGTLVRDFGRVGAALVCEDAVFRWESRPQLALLGTRADGPRDWLRAGQALQRVLLTATVYGVSASFLNQPLDLRDMRGQTRTGRSGHLQMIIRFGYGTDMPATPRRPVSDILETI